MRGSQRPKRRIAAILSVVTSVGLAAAALTAGSAAAATPTTRPARVVVHEVVDHTTDSYTFTASGPLCNAGTFVDDVTVVRTDRHHRISLWRVNTTYVCADESGTFTAVKLLTRIAHPTHALNVGTITFTGGTGAFAGLSGRGIDVGSSRNGHGAGTIRASVSLPVDIP
jgi:hypothetical protein